MKKVLLATAAVLVMTGCSQNEEFENPGQNGEIQIATIVSKAPRAAEATTATLETNGFMLYSFNTGAVTMEEVAADGLTGKTFIGGEKASHNPTWSIGGAPYYWPIGEKLQFFGYSPFDNVSSWATTGKYPSFSYIVQDTQEDLLASTVFDETKEVNTPKGALTLTFKHILTQINFKLKGGDAGFKYTVTEIKMTGVPSSGTYTYDDTVGAWSDQKLPMPYTYGATGYSEINGTGESTITGSDLGLMLIPNADLTGVKIVVTYSTTHNDKPVFSGSKEVTPTGVWGVGKKILYTLILPSGAEQLVVNPSVDGWNAEEDGAQGN